jgi:hypothetical protein
MKPGCVSFTSSVQGKAIQSRSRDAEYSDEHDREENVLHHGVDALTECRVLKAEVHRQIRGRYDDQHTHHAVMMEAPWQTGEERDAIHRLGKGVIVRALQREDRGADGAV